MIFELPKITSYETLKAFWPQTASFVVRRIFFTILPLNQKRPDWYSFRCLMFIFQLGKFRANFVYN